MKRKSKLPELLAPAGDYKALVAAILGGADAIYLGGEKFGARAYAKNFSEEELASAIKLCHMWGVRVYTTLNTLIFDKELDDAVSYAARLHKMGVDALIVSDLGVISRIRKEVPELELHASTQMGVHNTEGVNFAAALGCKRVVLARECSAADIKIITENSDAEIEVFLHGALCVCHSGQCLFSSMVGGRSGNRGECAQPCRLPYNNGKYPLSLNDLSLSEHIEELIASGVASLKIEGRMKSPDYVYEVTRIYRELLDKNRSSNKNERQRLLDIFSRGGFTDGYFVGDVFRKMTGVRSNEDKQISREISGGSFELTKIPVYARAVFSSDKAASLTLSVDSFERIDKDNTRRLSVTAYGDVPAAAENSPLTKEGLSARLSKMGNTPFSLALENIDLELDDGLNLPPSSINALRRDAVAMLEELFAVKLDKILQKNEEIPTRNTIFRSKKQKERAKKLVTALFFKKDTYEKLIDKNSDSLGGIDLIFLPLADYVTAGEKIRKRVLGVYIPPVIMEREWEEVSGLAAKARELGAEYALIGNISHVSLAKAAELTTVGDFRLNVANSACAELYASLDVDAIVLSPELTLPQARDIGGGVITLGRIPLMLTERCFVKENFGCDKCGRASFTDRKGAKFPILREYLHRNIIFNSAPTYMGDKKSELRAAAIAHEHYIFSSETADECAKLLVDYKRGNTLSIPHRRIGKR